MARAKRISEKVVAEMVKTAYEKGRKEGNQTPPVPESFKIIIKKGIDKKGYNYSKLYYVASDGIEKTGDYLLSRDLTHTTNEIENGVFYCSTNAQVRKGEQRLDLEPITPAMEDTLKCQIIVRRIKAAREWADNIATGTVTTVSGTF